MGTVEAKIKQLNKKKNVLLKQSTEVTLKLNTEFKKAIRENKVPYPQLIKSWNGRYNAHLGPILKQVRTIETVIGALK